MKKFEIEGKKGILQSASNKIDFERYSDLIDNIDEDFIIKYNLVGLARNWKYKWNLEEYEEKDKIVNRWEDALCEYNGGYLISLEQKGMYLEYFEDETGEYYLSNNCEICPATLHITDCDDVRFIKSDIEIMKKIATFLLRRVCYIGRTLTEYKLMDFIYQRPSIIQALSELLPNCMCQDYRFMISRWSIQGEHWDFNSEQIYVDFLMTKDHDKNLMFNDYLRKFQDEYGYLNPLAVNGVYEILRHNRQIEKENK